MARLAEFVQKRKEKLIEMLIENQVFKTSDQRQLYDAPLKILEEEYAEIIKKGKNF